MSEHGRRLELFAHSMNSAGKRQPLAEHLNNVADLAEKFAADFGQRSTARFIALAHDVGKAKETWQQRLMQLEAGLNPAFDEFKSDHKMAGATYAYALSEVAGLAVAGHHGGILNLCTLKEEMASGKWDASKNEALQNLFEAGLEIPSLCDDLAEDYFRILMLFSCLVDADSIDTSSHFLSRLDIPLFDDLSILYDRLLAGKPSCAGASGEVIAMRQAVRDACISSAAQARGFFSLHAPTGDRTDLLYQAEC